MDRSTLIISLALVTFLLVMAWAWYSKRRALSGKHYFGKEPGSKTGGQAGNDATHTADNGERPSKR